MAFIVLYPLGTLLLVYIIGLATDNRASSKALLFYYTDTVVPNILTSYVFFYCIPILIFLITSSMMTFWTFRVRKLVDSNDGEM